MLVDGKTSIAILDSEQRKLVFHLNVGEKDELEWFRWAGSERLLAAISSTSHLYGEEISYSRIMGFDLRTQTFANIVMKHMGPVGDDLLYTDPAGQYVLLSIQKSIFDWPSVWRFDLDRKDEEQATQVQAVKDGVFRWYCDDQGNVRMGLEFTGSKLKVWYRKLPGDDLKVAVRLTKDDFEDKVWDVVKLFAGSDEGYILKKAGNTVALRKFNFATRTPGDIVYQNPQWDLTDFDVGLDGKPRAAFYIDDKMRAVWFDDQWKTLHARLEKALPGTDIWVTSRAIDDSRMLIYSGREDDPGALYLYTAAKRSLEFLGDYRPQIDHALLATPKPIAFTARDKTVIHGYLTLPRGRPAKGLPLIILPHGGPYGIRDILAFDDDVQFLANRGYAVLQPNYRGSGGFGDDFDKLGDGQIGRRMQDDLDDGMEWLVQQGIADPHRVCVVGASYGGYAALWAVIRNPERYRCAVSFAGVTNWKKQLSYSVRAIDKDEWRDWAKKVRGDDEKFDLDSISPAKQIARLTRPVLLVHGDKDSRVPFSQFKEMRDAAQRAKAPVEPLVFAGEGHGFDKPEDRQRWFENLEAFLARNNPAN